MTRPAPIEALLGAQGPDQGWFPRDRFGMFIHWGPGALHPGEVSWARLREPISDSEYEKYIDHFDPDLYDPDLWIREAKKAGMRYAVLTTKHHDGFCLWDSALTDFKATNSPAGRDLVAPFVEACRRHGMKVGFYYSLLDWNHPHFTLDFLHPMREDPALRAQRRDMSIYVDYLHGQVRELLTGFGQIDLLWFDFSYADPRRRPPGWAGGDGKGRADWQSEALLRMIRELQPWVMVNDRLDLPADFVTREQYLPTSRPARDGRPLLWEACMTLNDTWAYDREDRNWKSGYLVLRSLIEAVSMGGNLLLNVGPNGRGELSPTTVERLEEIGQWLRVNGRAIYGCGPSEFQPPDGCRYTQRGNRLYVHLLAWPRRHLRLEGLGRRVEYCQFLHDASEVRRARRTSVADQDAWPDDILMLDLPAQPPGQMPVIELFLREQRP